MYSARLSHPSSMRQHCMVKRQALRGARQRVNVAADKPAAAETSGTAASAALAVLKEAARNASVAPKQVLQALVEVEKQKLPCDDAVAYLAKPGSRWKLVYSIQPDAVKAGYKGDKSASGAYFPLPAAWKFDTDPSIITYGIFLGSIAYMIFAGPYELKNGRKLEYDLTFMTLGLGPFKTTIPLKKDGALVDVIAKANGNEALLKTKQPFLTCAYVDEDIWVGRGSAGGVSLWTPSDSEWQAKSGVLRVMQ